jgi:hypothetical protein
MKDVIPTVAQHYFYRPEMMTKIRSIFRTADCESVEIHVLNKDYGDDLL